MCHEFLHIAHIRGCWAGIAGSISMALPQRGGKVRGKKRKEKRDSRMPVLARTVFVTRRRPANFSSSLFPPSSPRTFPRDWTLPTSAAAPWGEGARGGETPCITPNRKPVISAQITCVYSRFSVLLIIHLT